MGEFFIITTNPGTDEGSIVTDGRSIWPLAAKLGIGHGKGLNVSHNDDGNTVTLSLDNVISLNLVPSGPSVNELLSVVYSLAHECFQLQVSVRIGDRHKQTYGPEQEFDQRQPQTSASSGPWPATTSEHGSPPTPLVQAQSQSLNQVGESLLRRLHTEQRDSLYLNHE